MNKAEENAIATHVPIEIRINEIDADKTLFLRNDYDDDAIERYKALFDSGTQKPILLARLAERSYKLIDGFHRLKAAEELKWEKIQALIEEIPQEEWRGRAIAENNDATRGIFLKPTERNTQIGKLLEAGRTQEYMAQKFGLSHGRIAQIIEKDPILKLLATNKINITSVNEWLSGKSEAEIANIAGVKQPRVSQILTEFKKEIADQYNSGIPIPSIVLKEKEDKYNLTEDKAKEILTKEKEWLGYNRLVLGDCLKEIDGLPEKSIGLLLTDPPYGIEYQSNQGKEPTKPIEQDNPNVFKLLDKLFDKIKPKLQKDSNIFIFGTWKTYPQLYETISKHYKIKTVLVWIKTETGMGDLSSWMESYEFVIHAVNGNPKLNIEIGKGRPSNVLEGYKKVAGTNHPTEKPIDLLEKLIGFGSVEGGFVVDPFAGAGSTLLASMESKRKWYGIEIDKEYCDIANERIQSA